MKTTEDPHTIIQRAVASFHVRPGDLVVTEWDGSPINGVPAAEIRASLKSDAGPCPDARVVLVRVVPFDVAIYTQHLHPVDGAPLSSDAAVDWTICYLQRETLPGLVENPDRLRQAIAGALMVRVMRAVPAEVAELRREVESLVSDVSERLWPAGWHVEASHRVWEMLHRPGYEMPEDARLLELISMLGAWPEERGAWVPVAEWCARQEQWRAQGGKVP